VIDGNLDKALLESILFDYINLFRAKHNLATFTHDQQAASAATWMAGYQARTGTITHRSTTPGMETFTDRYQRQGGIGYALGAENTGWTAISLLPGESFTYDEMARRILDNWINSPHHLEALVLAGDGLPGGLGVGVVRGKYDNWDGVYATMDEFFYAPNVADYRQGQSVYATPPGQTESQPAAEPAPTPVSQKKTTTKKRR
jgi:uncharacterized protein YkwD